jgi:hypothetical protein
MTSLWTCWNLSPSSLQIERGEGRVLTSVCSCVGPSLIVVLLIPALFLFLFLLLLLLFFLLQVLLYKLPCFIFRICLSVKFVLKSKKRIIIIIIIIQLNYYHYYYYYFN